MLLHHKNVRVYHVLSCKCNQEQLNDRIFTGSGLLDIAKNVSPSVLLFCVVNKNPEQTLFFQTYYVT